MGNIGPFGQFVSRSASRRTGLRAALILAMILPSALAPVAAESATCDSRAPSKTRTEPSSPAAEALALGNVLAAAGSNREALATFEESERLAREEGNTALRALAAASAARSASLLSEGAAPDITRLDAAAGEAATVEDAGLRAQLRLHLGRSFMLVEHDHRAAMLFTEAFRDAEQADAPRLQSYALGYLGELYEGRGQLEDALGVTNRALFLAERAAAPDAVYRWQWQLGRIREARSQDDVALASYRDSVGTLRAARELAHSGTEPVYEGLVGLLITRSGQVEGEERQALLREVRDTLEDQNASELRDYFHDPCLDARRKTAPDKVPGTLVLYPILLEDRLILISSIGGVLESHVVPVRREDVVEEIRVFRKGLEDRTSRTYLRQARRLYEWLIRPIESTLASGKVETLVLVPRGALYTIPMAALQDEKTNQFLIEKVPIGITPGLTLTEPQVIDRASAELLAVGISEGVQGFSPLGYVPQEISAIFEIFPGRRLLNQKFVATSFEHELEQQPFDIVHLASHGEFAANAEDSFLLTFDGRISMDRLGQLVGKTRFRSRGLELLTLSACESAAGDDRAALGLAGVALQAGARSALATLWAVNDQVSAELMIDFYRQLAEAKQSRVAALQQAQVAILKQRAYRHPGFWAPYILIGSWL